MKRLTEKDDQGNWCLKGICWEQLHEGQVITGELWKKLYGALWKLMEYEDTGMTPEEVEKMHAEQDEYHGVLVTERTPKEITGWKKQMMRTFMGGERL